MSQIPVFTELVLDSNKFLSDLRAMEADFMATTKRMSQVVIGSPQAAQSVQANPGGPNPPVNQQVNAQALNAAATTLQAAGTSLNSVTTNLQNVVSGLASAITAMHAGGAGMGLSSPNWPVILSQMGLNPPQLPNPQNPPPPQRGPSSQNPAELFSRLGLGFITGERVFSELIKVTGQEHELNELHKLRSPLEQARRHLAIVQEQREGIFGMIREGHDAAGFRRLIPAGSSITLPYVGEVGGGSMQDIEATAEQAVRDAERNEKGMQLFRQSVDRRRAMQNEVLEATQGPTAARLKELEDWRKQELDFARAMLEKNDTRGAHLHQRQTEITYAVRAGRIQRQAMLESFESSQNADYSERSATFHQLRGQGRDREAGLQERFEAIQRQKDQQWNAYQRERNPVKRQQLLEEFNASEAARVAEIESITAMESRHRERDATAASSTLADLAQKQKEFGLVADNRGRAAGIASQMYSIDKRNRESRDAWRFEGDPTRKAQLEEEMKATAKTGAAQAAAIQAQEIRRIESEKTQFIIAQQRAALSEAEDDYKRQTAVFNAEWDARLRTMEQGEAKEEAIRTRKRLEQARDLMHSRQVAEQVTRFDLAAGQARLSMTPADQQVELKQFDAEWTERINKLKLRGVDQKVLEAADRERKAAREAMTARHARSALGMDQDTRKLELSARGHGALADVMDLADQLEDQMRDAGSDVEQQRRILRRGRARAHLMQREMFQPEMLGSWSEFTQRTQMGLLSGSGPAWAELGELIKGIERAEKMKTDAAMDKAFQESTDKLGKAADKITKSKPLYHVGS